MTEKAERITASGGWLTMWISWIGLCLNQTFYAIGIVLPAMMAELGFGPSQAGTLGAIGRILTAIFSIPLNARVSKFSTKLVIGLSIVGMGLAYLAIGWAPSYPILLVVRGVGVLIGMSMLSAVVILQNQWFSPAQMGTLNGMRLGMKNVGWILSMLGLPILMANFGGWRGAYYIMAAAMIPVAVAWFLLAKEKRTPEYEATMATQREARSPIGSVLRRKEIMLLGGGIAGAFIAYVALLTFWPTYAIEEKGLSLTACGQILSMTSVGAMIASFAGGIISDKIGLRRPQLFFTSFLLPAACFAMLQFDSPGILTVIASIVGFGAFSSMPVLLASPFELGLKPQEIAVSIGVLLTIISAGTAVGAQLTGIMIELLGMYTTLATLCAAPLIMTVCTMMLPETGPKARSTNVAVLQAE